MWYQFAQFKMQTFLILLIRLGLIFFICIRADSVYNFEWFTGKCTLPVLVYV